MSLLQKRIQGLAEDFSQSVSRLKHEISPKSVHRFRTTIRRIESLAAYTRPEGGKKQRKTLDALAGLRKLAGRVRDLDVEAGLLATIGNGSAGSDRRELMEVLKRKRSVQERKLASAMKRLHASRMAVHISRMARKTTAHESADASPLSQAKGLLTKLKMQPHSLQDLKPKRLHEVRIKLKRIRYLAEVDSSSAGQKRFLEEMEPVQDAIGEWHDWGILAKTAEKHFGDRANCALLMEIRSLFAARYFAAASAAARLLSERAPAPTRKPSRSARSAHPPLQRVS
jgi:CHAD domain-containing protein